MPNKDSKITQASEVKLLPAVIQHVAPVKAPATATKTIVKTAMKEAVLSPGAPTPAPVGSELLGSLTTQQQQRTSARVIKKLRLEPPAADRDKRETPECDTPNKIDEKDPLKFPTVKQRMPKALWSADEKSLFFEALNEYGKDFDSITAHICAKMKKKGMPDLNLKTKTQVSHFYYRTWHKLSKHVHFGENVKKVAQELYALINYGELRKKFLSVSEKTCARLHDMVLAGSIVVRHRGRNVRVRTPMCRALRRLNQITDRSCGGPCALGTVYLRARCVSAWVRVQAAAHNPRAAVQLPLRTSVKALVKALEKRWRGRVKLDDYNKPKVENEIEDIIETLPRTCDGNDGDLEDHLNLETDRIIVQEMKLPKKPCLHIGPRPNATIRLPVVRPSEQLSSQKICFSSYLERMYSKERDKDAGAKIRTPKRHRKDSTTDKDKEIEQKKFKMDEEPIKIMVIDETAVDGIELMANYKTNQEDEEKPSTEDEKELKAEETAEEDPERETDRDKDMSEREKDSFSEMEDDEKFNKSDTDNESDHGKGDKEKNVKFDNLKVKFRIRPKKRGGSIYTLVTDDEPKSDEPKFEEPKFEEPKFEEPKFEEPNCEPAVDVDLAVRQIRNGWSIHDAGDLTIGDLYLMFGSRSKLELDYWWAEPTPPLPLKPKEDKTPPLQVEKERKEKVDRTPDKGTDSSVEEELKRESDNDIFSPKAFGDSNDGMSGDERKSEQLLASPDRKPSVSCLNIASKLVNRPQPATPTNDGFAQLSDRLKRLLALVGNTHVSSNAAPMARCNCGHICSQHKKQGNKQTISQAAPAPVPQANQACRPEDAGAPVFRHPTPIAPKLPNESAKSLSMEGVPRWRRGRPRAADRRVVVQRLLPLLPKLPPPSNLIPVKIVPNSPPAPPRIMPKPPPTATSDLSMFYVLSECNGQFFFHDGDRRIPITPLADDAEPTDEEDTREDEESKEDFKMDISPTEIAYPNKDAEQVGEQSSEHAAEPTTEQNKKNGEKTTADVAGFLPSESLSLSPSRLLQSDVWLEGGVSQDFSLSSFLGQLDRHESPVDSHLQSLMAESSVDYIAKFADLAAEVTDERDPLT